MQFPNFLIVSSEIPPRLAFDRWFLGRCSYSALLSPLSFSFLWPFKVNSVCIGECVSGCLHP